MFALSTSWNALRYSRAKDIIKKIKRAGFDRVELNFNLSSAMVEEMVLLKEQGLIKVVSIHNFCPVPDSIPREMASPDIFSLSALDEDERKIAVRHTQKTIDTAARIGAKVVVLHTGKVEIDDKTLELTAFNGRKDKWRYRRLKEEFLKERRQKSGKFFTQTLKSLEQLCRYSQRHKIMLGIENRYYLCEIPIPEEMEIILKNFPGPPLYYWHDVGHAQVYEYLGFIKHKTILDRFSYRMIGIHLHDVKGIDDHLPPLKGRFNFALLKPYIKRQTLKVLEPHYPATAGEIIRGRDYLKELFSERIDQDDS